MNRPPTILEVWHGGGIPHGARRPPMCPLGRDCPSGLGVHSHTQRISEAPFSISWQNWIRYHMGEKPTLVVHVYGRSKP